MQAQTAMEEIRDRIKILRSQIAHCERNIAQGERLKAENRDWIAQYSRMVDGYERILAVAGDVIESQAALGEIPATTLTLGGFE